MGDEKPVERFHAFLSQKFHELSNLEKQIISQVWDHKDEFIQWPTISRLLIPGCVRKKYHTYHEEIKKEAKSRNIAIDSRSNGPAVMTYLLAGGKRPKRIGGRGWDIHHIYNGKFPFIEGGKTLHAAKNEKHFTQSADLVAIHPIAHALADEYFYFAWLLRYESFKRFNYDPDSVFCKEVDDFGFCR